MRAPASTSPRSPTTATPPTSRNTRAAPRPVPLSARLPRDHAEFTVRDEGPGFDVSTLPDPRDPANLEKASGRGVMLIRTFMDEVRYNDKGNQVTMTKRRPAPSK